MRILLSVLLFATTAFAIPVATNAQDAERGEKLFRRCVTCHTATDGGANKVGPNLFGILGRDIATRDGFRYSKALTGLEGNWTEEALNQYLLSPRTYARGTKMAFAGLKKSKDRADLIAWLKTLTNSEASPSSSAKGAEEPDADFALLAAGSGKQETYDNCAGCHSIKLVAQQGMNKAEWLETIEWMVDEQGMDPLDGSLNELIVDYLATHYGRDRPNFPK